MPLGSDASSTITPDKPVFVDGVQLDVIYIHENEIWLPSVEGVAFGSEVRQSSFRGEATDMFREFENEWKARWDRHKHVPVSQWSQICAFLRSHLKPLKCKLPTLCAQDLRGEIARKKPRCASGLDGVSLQDLKSMPDSILDAYIHLFDSAESDGSWPSQLVTGKVASLAKVPSPDSVQSYRPITVLSHGYRLWSGLRAKFLLSHLHPHCPSFLFGSRPHCQASQVWTHLAWAIEASFVSEMPVGGVIADIEKAFNHLPREVVFQTALSLAVPQKLLIAWSGALGQLRRRFQIREHMGPPVESTTGFPEGDALSCIGMMLLDFGFHLWFEKSFPLCQPISYVDDLQLITTCPSQVPQLLDHLLDFAKQVDLTVDLKKTFVWSNSAFHRANYRRKNLCVRTHARGLGAQLQFTRKHSAEVLAARLRDLEPLWSKLRLSHSPYKVKVLAIKQAAWTRGFHGVAASNVSDAVFTKLRSSVMKGLSAEGAGCSPVVHLGLVEHPLLDPKCWVLIDTLRTVREAASADNLSALLQAALDPDTSVPTFGMTSLLVNRLHAIGWSITAGVEVRDRFGTFSLLHTSFPELVHRVGCAWTYVVSSEVSHRKSFEGLEKCDPFATRRFLKSLQVGDQGLFRKALNGAHFTQDALCHWTASGSTTCEFCGCEDSRYHRFWQCPVFESERAHCDHSFWSILPILPPSVTLHGWALQPETRDRWYRCLQALEVPEVNLSPRPFSSKDDWIDVFSDGSCLWPSDPELKLAAWAIIQASPTGDISQSQVLLAGPVLGLLQSPFRAELVAVHQAIRNAWFWKKKLRIWSDCQSVVNRLQTIWSTHKLPAVNSCHADLWSEIHGFLECLDFNQAVVVTKVAAHTDVTTIVDAAEHWACVHNALADRAARLANLQRSGEFWILHKEHAGAVEFASVVTSTVQTTILNVSRRVVHREAVQQHDESEHFPVEHVPPIMSCPAPPWVGFSPRYPLALDCTAKFGHRFVASVTAWFSKGISEAHDTAPRWVSLHQLFLDYQFQTGELGPICDKHWVDTATQRRFRLKPHPFKKRSSWFGRAFRAILRSHDCLPVFSVTRPDSELLALHVPSVSLVWPQWRLTITEEWLGRHLPQGQAATRNGVQLLHLPPAKQDGRWPFLSIVSGPIGS